ncbi:hypothetical protein BTUL_0013g00240 [Botrytis tulipae]|uniref:Uncharacterized protein n=1 Tax=Botrytis tulipae TaxID=87230 RepID=A0A4Z1F8Y1_9HELO|nr:hypothetical protein BTUL_0013g00240 [Botrytis tulipae]
MARISRRAERQSSSSTNNIPQHDAICQPGFGLAAATRYKAGHRLDLSFLPVSDTAMERDAMQVAAFFT